MTKLILEIKTNNPKITRSVLNDFMTRKEYQLEEKYLGSNEITAFT